MLDNPHATLALPEGRADIPRGEILQETHSENLLLIRLKQGHRSASPLVLHSCLDRTFHTVLACSLDNIRVE